MLRVAVCQHPGEPGAVARNLAIMDAVCAEAAVRGARLVVFPELFLSGYWLGSQVRALAMRRDGGPCARVSEMARRHGLAICAGYPERGPACLYNSAILCARDGAVLGHYRKRRAVGAFETATFTDGDADLLVQMEGMGVGVLICYDSEFPENVRRLALAGAELVLVPTALSREYEVVALKLIPTRAFESSVFMAYADRCGEENGKAYAGLSCICAPDGSDLARAGARDAALLVADLDPAAVRAARAAVPYLRDARALAAIPGAR